jgi:hypothetical protein
MQTRILCFLPVFCLAAAAAAQTPVSPVQKVVEHHVASGTSQNVAEIMRDYADDALLIAPDGVYKGKQAIQGAFEQLLAQPAPDMTITRSVYEDDIGYIYWSMNAGQPGALSGSDTFIVRNGKIKVQTVAIFPPPPAPAPAPAQ